MAEKKKKKLKILGQKTPVKQQTAWTYQAGQGWTNTQQWIGDQEQINKLATKVWKDATDEDSGLAPNLNINISPAGNGLATLDIVSDQSNDDSEVQWDLQTSDVEQSVWTHPRARQLLRECPNEYKQLREDYTELKSKGSWDEFKANHNCQSKATDFWLKNKKVVHHTQGLGSPDLYAATFEATTGANFQHGSTWIDTVANKAYVAVIDPAAVTSSSYSADLTTANTTLSVAQAAWADRRQELIDIGNAPGFENPEASYREDIKEAQALVDQVVFAIESGNLDDGVIWHEVTNICCMKTETLFGVLRDGSEGFISSKFVLRHRRNLPTDNKTQWGVPNTNKTHTWKQMQDLVLVPDKLHFALPQYGEWLRKAPNVSYERHKIQIETEFWWADDWSNYLYDRAS